MDPETDIQMIDNKKIKIKVSVVIPTKDRPDFVMRAVRSALAQTFRDIEVIVVIDGPDKKTEDALGQVEDKRLRVMALPGNVGGADARNLGVKAARGEWVAFLDDDDEWLPEKLEKQMGFAHEKKEKGKKKEKEKKKNSYGSHTVISCKTIARTPGGDFIRPQRDPGPDEPLSEYLFGRRSFFQGDGVLPVITWLVKKELMEKVPFQSGLKKYQDWDWVLRAARLEGVRFEIVPEPLAIWHVAEGGRQSVGTACMWEYSLAWLRKNRDLVTPRAYSGFVASQLAPQAASKGEWKVFFLLLREMYGPGAPRAADLFLFLAMWLIPQDARRKIRGFSFFKKQHRPGPIQESI